jgi:predicted nucleic acid-binding protein
MKIFIDNNIVIDALLTRQPFDKAAELLLKQCVDLHDGYLSTNSLTNIFYVLKKSIGAVKAKSVVKELIELYKIISVTDEDCINALFLSMNDFEDALIATCAQKIKADYIVTRDELFIKAKAPVKIISPADFLSIRD